MEVRQILPFVRYAHYTELLPEFTSHPQTAYDQRIFFCARGKVSISVAGKDYLLSESDLLYIPSGTEYHLHHADSSYLLAGINFDFTDMHRNLITPIVPASERRGGYKPGMRLENITFSDAPCLNAPFYMEKQTRLLNHTKQIINDYETKLLFYSEKCSAILKLLLTQIVQSSVSSLRPLPKKTADIIITYIQDNFNRNITNEIIGQELNFHPNYLNRVMLHHTGKSLHQYLMSYRLSKALDMLQLSSLPITDIARECGFPDVSQFSRFFRKQTGYSPSSFR